MSTSNSILIISCTSPYANQQSRAALDLALTAAAFEQPVSVVFMDDGILQLVEGQETSESKLKNVGKMVSALSIYEVEDIYAHQDSVDRSGLGEKLPEHVETIENSALAALIDQADQVMVF